MARPPISDQPMSNAEHQARHRAKATEAGGKTLVVPLSSEAVSALAEIRAARGDTSDRATVEGVLKEVRDAINMRKRP